MLPVLVLLRAGKRLLFIALLLLAGALCVALLFPWLRQGTRARIKLRWSAGLLSALGVDLPHDTALIATLPQGLIVANHISFIDIFVINAMVPVTFVAKSEVARWPLIGWLTARTDNLFIERGRRGAAHLTQQAMGAVLSDGRRLVLFPEGTTTRGDSVLPFHAALLQSAVDSAVPVSCVALGYRDARCRMTTTPAFVGEDTLWDCIWRIVSSDGVVAQVSVAAQLAGAGSDRRHLAHQAHRCIARTVAAWYDPAQRNKDVTWQQSSCHWPAKECDVSTERTGERHESEPEYIARPSNPGDGIDRNFVLPLEPGA
jgi:1-acyl-sn-glycerol-3-phosphate acyltransferase